MSTDLKQLDKLLEEIRNSDKIGEKRQQFFEVVCKFVGLEIYDTVEEILFNSSNSALQKQCIAMCLLRLLCSNDKAIWGDPKREEDIDIRVKTFNLFDEHLTEIYGFLKILPNNNTHDKLSKLKDIELRLIKSSEDITNAVVSLNTAMSIRGKLKGFFNTPHNKIFLRTFIDQSLLDIRLDEIFENITTYHQSPATEKLSIYEETVKNFDTFLGDIAANESIWAKRCLANPIQKIYQIIRDDFVNNDAIKPTSVTIRNTNRKYPFHKMGTTIQLKFEIENNGPGYAFDVQVEILMADDGIEISKSQQRVGDLKPQKLQIIFEAIIQSHINSKSLNILGELSWNNYQKEQIKTEFEFELLAQPNDLDWDKLQHEQPYSLEEVTEEEDLVGREEIKNKLYGKLMSKHVESSIIYGQKRVGKSSIAKTIKSKFRNYNNYTVIYIPMGDLDKSSPSACIQSLGKRITTKIAEKPELKTVSIPKIENALSPALTEYFESVQEIVPTHKFVIIIDEFDEIPSALYPNTSMGDTFFHNIRSLSSSGKIAFILVGGEKMQIITQSTDRLNKFDTFRVDYFDKGKYWNDFQDLVRRPIKDILEFTDEAINKLYEFTEGNPFFTKLICRQIYAQACSDKNTYISVDEVNEMIHETIKAIGDNNINYFWKDGISVDNEVKRDQIETQRRKFLIVFADAKRCGGGIQKDELCEKAAKKFSDVVATEIWGSFINRGILIEDNDSYRIKPLFFEKWLIEYGIQLISASYSDEDALIAMKKLESDKFVTDREIVDTCKKWGIYRSQAISHELVRTWLDQFKDITEKRLMFQLLISLKFYSEGEIREKLSILHRNIIKNYAIELKREGKESKRRGIILSCFGEVTKSGPFYARLYARENKIISDDAVIINKIPEILERRSDEVNALIFIDDIIGSGETVRTGLEKLNELCGTLLAEKKLKVIVAAICGLETSITKLREYTENKFPFQIEFEICDELDEKDQCFSEKSSIFETPEERLKARGIAFKVGQQLQKKHPLGYDDSQFLIVFYETCPNNTLPIFWDSSTNPKWIPLFPRH